MATTVDLGKVTGEQGPQGAQGPIGPTGPQGPRGFTNTTHTFNKAIGTSSTALGTNIPVVNSENIVNLKAYVKLNNVVYCTVTLESVNASVLFQGLATAGTDACRVCINWAHTSPTAYYETALGSTITAVTIVAVTVTTK